eukprot:TRINITY_DN20158_c0_g1_i1.p1 TRINITY_DN20158_c0_g1~~TRINITY_DN20158_c0_g1_i1.p1  ORF type:complete len:320 (-),score=83.24 TRINITY_DN20158_c0_g1_i1:69-1028(-)
MSTDTSKLLEQCRKRLREYNSMVEEGYLRHKRICLDLEQERLELVAQIEQQLQNWTTTENEQIIKGVEKKGGHVEVEKDKSVLKTEKDIARKVKVEKKKIKCSDAGKVTSHRSDVQNTVQNSDEKSNLETLSSKKKDSEIPVKGKKLKDTENSESRENLPSKNSGKKNSRDKLDGNGPDGGKTKMVGEGKDEEKTEQTGEEIPLDSDSTKKKNNLSTCEVESIPGPIPNRTLFVSHLPSSDVGLAENLKKDFSSVGEVVDVRLIYDRYHGGFKRCACLEYATLSSAEKAIESFHDRMWRGMTLNVNYVTTPSRGKNNKK